MTHFTVVGGHKYTCSWDLVIQEALLLLMMASNTSAAQTEERHTNYAIPFSQPWLGSSWSSFFHRVSEDGFVIWERKEFEFQLLQWWTRNGSSPEGGAVREVCRLKCPGHTLACSSLPLHKLTHFSALAGNLWFQAEPSWTPCPLTGETDRCIDKLRWSQRVRQTDNKTLSYVINENGQIQKPSCFDKSAHCSSSWLVN